MKGNKNLSKVIVIASVVGCIACGGIFLDASATPIPEPDITPGATLWEEVAAYSETPAAPEETPDAMAAFNGDVGADIGVNPEISLGDEGNETLPDGGYITQDCYSSGLPTTYHILIGDEAEGSSSSSSSTYYDEGSRGDGKKCVRECRDHYSGKDLCKCLDYCSIAIKTSNGCDVLEKVCKKAAGAVHSICMFAYLAAC